jgi:hypothetical protein
LCFNDKEYYSKLSEASRTTLRHQGGPMTEEEATKFKLDPDFETFLLMRKFDEAAKNPGFDTSTITLATFSDVITQHLSEKNSERVLGHYLLSQLQLESFKENGFIKISNLLRFDQVSPSDLHTWVEEIAKWPTPPAGRGFFCIFNFILPFFCGFFLPILYLKRMFYSFIRAFQKYLNSLLFR